MLPNSQIRCHSATRVGPGAQRPPVPPVTAKQPDSLQQSVVAFAFQLQVDVGVVTISLADAPLPELASRAAVFHRPTHILIHQTAGRERSQQSKSDPPPAVICSRHTLSSTSRRERSFLPPSVRPTTFTLTRHGSRADVFVQARLNGGLSVVHGMLPEGIDQIC